jgi:DNA modification methylase
MTNEEAAEVLGNLNPEDDMSAMALLPKQPEIIDISKPKKGKGAHIQKLVGNRYLSTITNPFIKRGFQILRDYVTVKVRLVRTNTTTYSTFTHRFSIETHCQHDHNNYIILIS